jgi:hypothetical protein
MKTCISCCHVVGISCHYPLLLSPVTGEKTAVLCANAREVGGFCGPEGRFWFGKMLAVPDLPSSDQ